jgi:hypothetical protein
MFDAGGKMSIQTIHNANAPTIGIGGGVQLRGCPTASLHYGCKPAGAHTGRQGNGETDATHVST